MKSLTRRHLILGGVSLLGAGAVVACAPQPQPSGPDPSAGPGITHIHAITRDPDESAVVLLAAHEGLFRLQDQQLTGVGPVIDLMGFTVTPDGRYLASGHPGPGTDLPEPLGLIESTDQGESWEVLSRGGESDFHALAANSDRVLGFDGQLRSSPDGRTWETFDLPSMPAAVALAEGSGMMWSATEDGVLRSEDGSTWETLDAPQLIRLLAWAADDTIVGASVEGHLLISHDAGSTWTVSRDPVGEVSALGASSMTDGAVEVLLVVGDSVLRTFDGGETLDRLL